MLTSRVLYDWGGGGGGRQTSADPAAAPTGHRARREREVAIVKKKKKKPQLFTPMTFCSALWPHPEQKSPAFTVVEDPKWHLLHPWILLKMAPGKQYAAFWILWYSKREIVCYGMWPEGDAKINRGKQLIFFLNNNFKWCFEEGIGVVYWAKKKGFKHFMQRWDSYSD